VAITSRIYYLRNGESTCSNLYFIIVFCILSAKFTYIYYFHCQSFELGRRKRFKQDIDTESKIDSNGGGKVSDSSTEDGIIQVNEDIILGHGGHGTVVYKGMLEGRQVAVKRMLKTYHASAEREISLLIESDGHPNVVRYHLKEVRGDFVYLALELCDLSLHDLIGHVRSRLDRIGMEDNGERKILYNATKEILLQITKGAEHLHRLRIVHRDLKPANILLANKRNHKSSKSDATSISTICETFIRGDYVAKVSCIFVSAVIHSFAIIFSQFVLVYRIRYRTWALGNS
jgi:Protein kinase domain